MAQEGHNGKRDRDAALTWDVPPELEEADKAAVAGRPAFAAVAGKHLEALVAQLLEAEGLDGEGRWAPLVCQLAQLAASLLSPTAAVAFGKLDPRYYIKVKRLVTPDADPAESAVVQGVAMRKSLAHKRMRSSITQPRIMLLGGSVEPQLSRASPGSAASKLSSFDALMDQEQQYLEAAVERIASFSPDVLVVERSVGRYAQEVLLSKDISLVLNVKRELLERLARCTGAQVAPSLDQLTSHCIGHCKAFEVESLQLPANSTSAAAASTEISPRDLPEGHLVADAAALRKAAAAGAVQQAGPRAVMLFRGCPRQLGCTILLRGSDAGELRRVKRVATFAAYAAYWGILEAALLSDQLAAAAATVLPGGGQPDAVAGMADAVASTSYLATAEARGRQAILSASAHVSIVLERGTSASELDLPTAASNEEQHGSIGIGNGGSGVWEEDAPDSPASSDSTNMWVLPAEAGAATFTVAGSQSLGEAEEDPTQRQQQAGESEAGTPKGGSASSVGLGAPGSPQDPLHLAAKELALRQLQLTGSEPPSPAAGAEPLGAAPDPGDASPIEQQGAPGGSSRDTERAAAQLSRRASVVSSQQLAAADAVALAHEPSGQAVPAAPGMLISRSQQLWLAISCKNPAKAILCEPSHAHCMEFYADTDLPLAAFISAAAPPNRKCPHPQCGDGAPLHLRSFMHGNGLVTLSSVRLPAGKELPEGRVWMWLRVIAAANGAEGAAAARRVPLSSEAACLSFAHLLSLLLDARHLSLGGMSLQRDFVRYLGSGSTLLCLHYSPAPPYIVNMPPRQVELLPEMEDEWLQEEIKQLTEEADEAFGAIEYALGEQLRVLEGSAEPEPEFAQMWLDTLADTRATFLDTIQDTITQLDSSPRAGGSSEEQQQQQAGPAVSVVWELNRLRSLLAAVVLQWATCLHEGTPSSHAAPPSGASALTTVLQSRRAAAGHSRNVSGEVLPTSSVAAAADREPAVLSQADLSPSPFSQQPTDQNAAEEQPLPAAAEPVLQQQQQQQQAALDQTQRQAPVPMQMQRRDSTASLGRQFIEASAAAGGPPQPSASSELNFGAPSLHGEDVGSLANSPHSSIPIAPPAFIPTGLVARYIAMFDQSRDGGRNGGSSSSSPTGKAMRSQRTHDWVQAADSEANALQAAAGVASSPATAADISGPTEGGGSSGDGDSVAASDKADLGRQQQQLSPPQQQGQGQRPSFFRLDLTNPDPELVQALTPKHRSTADEAEAEAPPSLPGRTASRLEQLSARLGRMSLTKSFTERRRSSISGCPLGHAQSADSPSLLQQLDVVAEQQQLAQVQQQQAQLSQRPQQDWAPVTVMPAPAAAAAADAAAQQGSTLAAEESAAEGVPLAGEISAKDSASHWDEWSTLLVEGGPGPPDAGEGDGGGGGGGDNRLPLAGGSSGIASPLRTAASGRQDAISKLQEAPMPPDLSLPSGLQQDAREDEQPEAVVAPAVTATSAAAAPTVAVGAVAPVAAIPATLAAAAAAAVPAASTAVAAAAALPPPSRTQSFASSSRSLLPAPAAGGAGSGAPSPPLASEKAPSKLMQLLGKLRSELAPGHMPLTAGKVELSGRALLPGGADGMRVAVFDDEPTSIIAYFLATKEYQQYLHDAVATVLFGEARHRTGGLASSAATDAAAGGADGEQGAAAMPGSWQSLPSSPRRGSRRSSLVPGLQHQQQHGLTAAGAPLVGGAAAADAVPLEAAVAAAGAGGVGAPGPTAAQLPSHSRAVSQEELAAEQSGDWQVLFHEQQLDCQLALEDPSPGMPWGRAKFQIIAYYAPQFAELRRRCVVGGEQAFLASISRCRKWATRGGKSAAYFARSCDKRYIVKQLSRSERQSFLEFAPDYFRYVATMLHRGQDTCLAKVLGVYQVSVQYTGGRGAPAVPPFGGKEGVMDLLVTENVFYGRDTQVSRIYDLKGSQRDRYAADNPAVAGAVLLDENLKELNLTSPTLVGPRTFARLQRALWSDTSFLAGLGVMDYSLLVGVDKQRQELVVGVIDYIRQYTWDKQVETWVKKSGILGGAGKDPTVISPKQYSRRFRIAMSSYLTVVPAWEPPEPPLDPDAM